MRKVRIIYPNAYYHVMNRGVLGRKIFPNDKYKKEFLKLLKKKSIRFKIKIIAYDIMDNHFHLDLQDRLGNLPDFMRELDGEYALKFRSLMGGKGHVFQNRYKSVLIQDEKHLQISIIYILLNPNRSNITSNPFNYNWSSINEYFSNCKNCITDKKVVEEMFGSKECLKRVLQDWILHDQKLDIQITRYGGILGDKDFKRIAIENFNRRISEKESYNMRIKDIEFKNSEKVIKEFEEKYSLKINEIDTTTKNGKILRLKLLVLLRDDARLKYKEIIKLPIFRDLKYSSLSKLYQRSKKL